MRRIGGSDIPKLLGVSRYGNEADVYLRIVEGLEDEWKPVMERGAAVEPRLRAIGQEHFALELLDTESDYHAHPEHDFAHAQIDDIALHKGRKVCLDYKSQSRWAKGWGPDGTDVVPESIRAQLAWEMACADLDLGGLIVGFGDDVEGPEIFSISHVVSYWVPRDGVYESHCLQVAREFWRAHVLPRVPPSCKPIGKKKQAVRT